MNRSQPSLDFVDVDTFNDVALFIDPYAIKSLQSVWGNECVYFLQSYFSEVLLALKCDNQKAGMYLLSNLREPNETHLGLSRNQSQGHAVGSELATDLWNAFRQSAAAQSGLLEDLEDTILLIEGIGPDIISDMTSNNIGGPLIRYSFPL